MNNLIKPLDCPHCKEEVIISYDERLNLWDCVHFCYSRMWGAINYKTRDEAIKEWNKLARKEGAN